MPTWDKARAATPVRMRPGEGARGNPLSAGAPPLSVNSCETKRLWPHSSPLYEYPDFRSRFQRMSCLTCG